MKTTLKSLKKQIKGDVLPTDEHRMRALEKDELRAIAGGLRTGATDSCCPCADDCED